MAKSTTQAAEATESPDREPRFIHRQIQFNDCIWCLIEYTSPEDQDEDSYSSKKIIHWRQFESTEELERYTHRICGEPLRVPPQSLTAQETEQMVRIFSQILSPSMNTEEKIYRKKHFKMNGRPFKKNFAAIEFVQVYHSSLFTVRRHGYDYPLMFGAIECRNYT